MTKHSSSLAHNVIYSQRPNAGTKEKSYPQGTRTDDGYVYKKMRRDTDQDIVNISWRDSTRCLFSEDVDKKVVEFLRNI